MLVKCIKGANAYIDSYDRVNYIFSWPIFLCQQRALHFCTGFSNRNDWISCQLVHSSMELHRFATIYCAILQIFGQAFVCFSTKIPLHSLAMRPAQNRPHAMVLLFDNENEYAALCANYTVNVSNTVIKWLNLFFYLSGTKTGIGLLQ